MSTKAADSSTTARASRASSSRCQVCLPTAPTTRPNAICPHKLGYVWKGSAKTQNVHQETVLLDVYWLPSTNRFLYMIEILNNKRMLPDLA
jgi:hypothetical protein